MDCNSYSGAQLKESFTYVTPDPADPIVRVHALLNSKLIKESDLKPNWKEELSDLQLKGISWLYHFSPECNLGSILEHGLVSREYASEAGITLKQYGGNQISHNQSNSFGYVDFVHRCFCTDRPMMPRVVRDSNQYLLLFYIDPIVIAFNSTQLTDRNAAANAHQPMNSLVNMSSDVIEATQKQYVSRNSSIFEPHQAEVMVKHCVPPYLIKYYEKVTNIAPPAAMSS